ncbi:MAG: xanthine dehydrogenase family protein molybdopterin-binding subunit [Gemmatimonadaceae bacterium]|nr:xanthine dehydrogenase family protein molybdopterin-binding subunit [Gemmatimonadaceae bacterium]
MSGESDKSLITRRVFVGGLGLTAVGLYFGVYAPRQKRSPFEKYSALNPDNDADFKGLNPNVFIHVAPVTGLVSVVCHRSEMGQGVRSSLPVLFADELGADMQHVRVIQGEGNAAYGDQNTDGSSSVRGVYQRMRSVAATARMMLISAAAAELKVPESELVAENHEVVHAASGRKLKFGDLAIAAGALPVPAADKVVLRPNAELKRVGTNKLPLIDGPDYVSGKAVFGADVSVPDMLIAVIARPPVLGGKPSGYNRDAALKVPGVRHVVDMPHPQPPYGFQPWGGVAVVAENTWAAMKGRDALELTWDNPAAHASYDTAAYRDELFKSVRAPGTAERNVGDVDAALKSSASTIEAEYYVPHLAHASMEPPVALARYNVARGGSCEVWAPTQNPQAVRTEVARALGIAEDRVQVYVTLLGGAFGRKSKADFCSEAALVSKAVGQPVRVQWTRTDDIHNDYLNAVSAQHLTAGLDSNGKVTAWRHRTAFPPIGSTFAPGVDVASAGDLQQGMLDVVLDVPNVRIEACKAAPHVRVGWLRSVYNIFHAFAINSFLDEVASARKKDPLDNLLELYGPARIHTLQDLGIKELGNYGGSLEEHPVDGERLQGVLKHVATMANWSERAGVAGRGFGIAAHRSFNSYAAVVASVRASSNGAVSVDEVWIALDPGQVINPDRVHAQLEGSVLSGMSHIIHGGVTHAKGAAEQRNFDTLQLVRNQAAPRKIHTAIVESGKPHGGVGEPGVPPVAPAIANAVFALTGKRVREFRPTGVFA